MENKNFKFTLENVQFRINDYVMKPITENGHWDKYWDKWEVNLSSVWTYLIHRVGRYTEFYASDVFYTWNEVQKALKESEIGCKTFLIGIRYSGVDGNNSIASKIRNKIDLSKEYIDGIYMLTIQQEDDDITVTFGKTDWHCWY